MAMEFWKDIKPLTGAKDWPTWKDNVLDVLALYNAVDIVDGSRPCPELAPEDASEKLSRKGQKVSRKVAKIECSGKNSHISDNFGGTTQSYSWWDFSRRSMTSTSS